MNLDDATGVYLSAAGGRTFRLLGGKPMLPDGEGLLVVAQGTVDAFYVPLDDEGRPRLPEFVAQLSTGDVVVRSWWTNPTLRLPAGAGALRPVGEATLLEVPPDADLPAPLANAVERWLQIAKAFAQVAPSRDADVEAARLERRRLLDDALASEGERALLGVFKFETLPKRPPGLSPLACALADAAEAAGSPVEPHRLIALAGERDHEDVIHEVAARLRIPIRAVTLSGRWWRQARQPLVILREGGPVALLPGRGYVIDDPSGTSVPLLEGERTSLQVEAWEVYPRLPDRPPRSRNLVRFGLHGENRLLAALAALVAVIAVLGVILPYATAHIIGVIVPSGAEEALHAMLIALAAFTVAFLVATVAQSLAVLALSSRAATLLTAAMWDRLLHVPPSFFRDKSAGELAQQVTAFDQMRMLIGSSVVAALAGSALAVASIVLLLAYASTIGLVVIPVFILTLTVAAVIVRRQGRSLQTVIDDRNRLNGLLLGLLSGVSKLRVAGAERRAHALWRRGYAFQQEAQRDAAFEGVRLSVLQGLLSGMFLLTVIVAVSALQSAVSLDRFTTSVAAAGQLAAATGSMIVVAGSMVQLRPLYRSALPIIETPPEVRVWAPFPEEFSGELRLDAVTFGYSEGAVTLDHVSFLARTGTFVAIVGPSGAGKTTIFRIILGFEEPWQGEVFLDGKPIDSLDIEAVRRRIGTVIQGARIMSGTILTNILGTLPLGPEAAWEAAEMAGIADDIKAMPMQMSTMVAEGGAGFSGGQVQRLLVARALVRKPKILLLDEATSALDNETQKAVMDHLRDLGVTTIVVAHRLSTVQQADHIVVLDRGRVVEDGPFDALIANNGLFATLARRQVL
ncbi:MAG: ATP-binding cassette domain-containing protein [Solirubrobacterales bacterium]|nr:ATP-binding cassette domain-containing protein [Solirubrobacterales bacterium]